jgi:hypothetical protein
MSAAPRSAAYVCKCGMSALCTLHEADRACKPAWRHICKKKKKWLKKAVHVPLGGLTIDPAKFTVTRPHPAFHLHSNADDGCVR